MRRALVALLALVSLGTASPLSAQEPPPGPSAAPPPPPTPDTPPPAPSAVPPPPATPPTPAASASPAASSAPTSHAVAPSSPSAGADVPVPETGFEIGVRIAFSAFFGGNEGGSVLGAMPLWLDAARRFSRQLVLGIYGGIAVVYPVEGTAYDLFVGVQGQYHLSKPILGLDPWLGVLGSYELVNVNVAGQGMSFSGPSGGIQAGLDYKRGFGPFAAFTIGSFGSGDVHELVTIGMRGTYDW